MTGDRQTTLNLELRARGFHRKATGRILWELVLHVLVTGSGATIFALSGDTPTRFLGIVVAAIGSVGVGTNSHTSSHYGTSEKRWVNETLTYFGLPLFLHLSATYWWHKHLTRHHPAPNVPGVDTDIDFHPWFALTELDLRDASRWWRTYYRLQWLLLPVALLFNGFIMQAYGWRHVLCALASPARRRVAHWIDLASLVMYWLGWVALPAVVLPVEQVLLFAVGRTVVAGYVFFFVLAPAHFPSEAVCFTSRVAGSDFMLLQTATTVNFRAGFLGRLLCSGLQYQIEHHLFPSFSHVYYPQMSVIVRAFCLQHGYPHRTLGWGEAIVKSFAIFRHPKPVLTERDQRSPRPAFRQGGHHV